MADTWGNPEKKIVVASAPVMDGTKQAHDKYATAALKYKVRFDGATQPSFTFCISEPQAGEEIEVHFFTSTNAEGKSFTSYWTTEAKALKSASSGRGGGGGAKPNYTTEQEAMKDGMLIAIVGLSTKSFMTKEGTPMHCNADNLKMLGGAIAKIILEAGK